jgi:hypothetical protein
MQNGTETLIAFDAAIKHRILKAVVLNVSIFWDMASCSPYVSRRFQETYHLHLQGGKSDEQETRVQEVDRYWIATFKQKMVQ